MHKGLTGIRKVEIEESNNIQTRAVGEDQVHKFAFKFSFRRKLVHFIGMKITGFYKLYILKNS